mmetsp:Transcript_3498/g.5210  ORF Transcript_3498/g.5210 Transcript_3498/m.5210 type:complete len:120 (+) Transcript_3498:320-679(+)
MTREFAHEEDSATMCTFGHRIVTWSVNCLGAKKDLLSRLLTAVVPTRKKIVADGVAAAAVAATAADGTVTDEATGPSRSPLKRKTTKQRSKPLLPPLCRTEAAIPANAISMGVSTLKYH